MTRWQAFAKALANGGWTGVANVLIGLSVTLGLLSAGQSSALTTLVAGCATFLNLLVAVVHTFQEAKTIQLNSRLMAENRRLRLDASIGDDGDRVSS